jgi:hypothetical protein
VEIEHSGTSLEWSGGAAVLRRGVKRLRGARLGLCGGKDQAWNCPGKDYTVRRARNELADD